MKKAISILIFLSFISCGTQKIPLHELDTLSPVTLYKTTDNFINEIPMEINAGVLIKDESDQHITIKKGIFDLKTGLKIDKGLSAWALKYNNENYFNLGYSNDINHWKTYAKFDIEGKYCAIIIDDNSPNILTTTSNTYGGGLAGFLIAESLKWNKNWKDKYGNKKKILFIDTQDVSRKRYSRNESSHGNYLSRKQFQKIIDELEMTWTNEKIKDLKFERIIEIIETANRK